MIEAYFARLENLLQETPYIRAYTLKKKVYNLTQGYIGGSIIFEDGHRLEFIEVKDVEAEGKLKYRYQYMDENQRLIFRYDNAPHHRDVSTFPHHKHTLSEVGESSEPTLDDILLEIAQMERKKQQL